MVLSAITNCIFWIKQLMSKEKALLYLIHIVKYLWREAYVNGWCRSLFRFLVHCPKYIYGIFYWSFCSPHLVPMRSLEVGLKIEGGKRIKIESDSHALYFIEYFIVRISNLFPCLKSLGNRMKETVSKAYSKILASWLTHAKHINWFLSLFFIEGSVVRISVLFATLKWLGI